MTRRQKRKPTLDEELGIDGLSETRSLDLVLEGIVARNDPDGRRTRTGRGLRNVWTQVVGESVAAHTQSIFLREGGELVVGVDTPVWVTELSLFITEYQKQLNAALGEDAIKSIRFRVAKAR